MKIDGILNILKTKNTKIPAFVVFSLVLNIFDRYLTLRTDTLATIKLIIVIKRVRFIHILLALGIK